MHEKPYVVLTHPFKPTLTSKIHLDYSQQLLIGFQNILPVDSGTVFLLSILRLEEINVRDKLQKNTFKPFLSMYGNLCGR